MTIKPHDEARIRNAVRHAIVDVLEGDYDGGELVMKEVWEECGSVDEVVVAKDEIRAIIALVKGRP